MDLRGICLRTTNYRDKDKLLSIATFEKGRITAVARGVRSQKAKLKAGCMPMVFGEFSFVGGKGRNVLTGINIEESFHNCWLDTKRNCAALLILELLEKMSIEGENISHEILLALKSLKEINYNTVYPVAISVWFITKVLKYTGVDYTIEEMPYQAMNALNSLSMVDSEEVETLDIDKKAIDTALNYLGLIVKNQLGINLLLIKQIVNLNIGNNVL